MVATKNRKLLIIDDDRMLCDLVQRFLNHERLTVWAAHSGAAGVALCQQQPIDIVLLDQKLPDGEGRSFCADILKSNEQTKIIFITAFPSFENAVKGIQSGAHDYLAKPFEMEELRLTVDLALRTLDLESCVQLQHYKRNREKDQSVLIDSGGLDDSHLIAQRAAQSDAPVIITGETGTGKSVMARHIHFRSERKEGAFLSINCAALPENLIEAELFGAEKGAFTGAEECRKGIFEMADGGTLLLDEIGEMPLHLQAKLLNVLEEGQLRRLGGARQIPVDVRIVAATNSDLEVAVRNHAFREDLYFRLNVLRLHLPPLRDRRQDIPDLCRYFLEQLTLGRHFELAESEIAMLADYTWPGNIRELKNIIERAVIFHENGTIYPSRLLTRSSSPETAAASPCQSKEVLPLEEMIRNYTLCVLDQMEGNITRTARVLDVPLSTLKRRLKSYQRSSY